MNAKLHDGSKQHKTPFWPRRNRQTSPETIIIDTSSLVNYSSVTLTPNASVGNDTQLLEAAARAVTGASTIPLTHIRGVLPAVSVHPVATHAGIITGATWHHGNVYTSYWIGSPEDIIQRSDLTENERELLLAKVRKLSNEGKLSYCVATNQVTQTKESKHETIKPHDLKHLGIISHEIQLHVGTIQAVALCAKKGITVIYASSDTESIVAAVAYKAGLLGAKDLPHNFVPGIELASSARVYAHMNDHARRQLLASLDSNVTLTTSEPLPSVVALTIK